MARRFTGEHTMEAIRKRLRGKTPALLALPSIILVLLIAIYPILFAFSVSMTNRRLNASEYHFIWFANYIDMFTNPTFWAALWRTLQYTGLTVGVEMLLGFGIALLLNQALRGRTIFRIIMLIPLMLPPASGAMMWRSLLDPSLGWINFALSKIGIMAPAWLGNANTALITVAGIDVYHFTPFVILILLAALQSVPRLQYEVAEVDGASRWQVFRMVTLPQIRPTIYLVLLFRLVWSLNSYDVIQVATNGGPGVNTTTLAFEAVQAGFRYYAFGLSGAYCIFLFFIILVISKNLFSKVNREWA
jgi:multiple sugar transport system permease protein